MTTERGYNGWANYETWAVALWIGNEAGSHEYWEREQAGECYRAAVEAEPGGDRDGWTRDAAHDLAGRLKRELDDEAELPRAVDGTMYADLLERGAGRGGLARDRDRVRRGAGPRGRSSGRRARPRRRTRPPRASDRPPLLPWSLRPGRRRRPVTTTPRGTIMCEYCGSGGGCCVCGRGLTPENAGTRYGPTPPAADPGGGGRAHPAGAAVAGRLPGDGRRAGAGAGRPAEGGRPAARGRQRPAGPVRRPRPNRSCSDPSSEWPLPAVRGRLGRPGWRPGSQRPADGPHQETRPGEPPSPLLRHFHLPRITGYRLDSPGTRRWAGRRCG